jgi:phenylalanyl-tRNA synthetase beta chain
MKYSYSLLSQFIENLPKPFDLAEFLSLKSMPVEGIEEKKFDFKNIVVGKILKLEKHPYSDRLSLASVDIGKSSIKRIICGAKNIDVGQFVPVALPGALLPNGNIIKEKEILGIRSEGMLCSSQELGLSDNAFGILILKKGNENFKEILKPGQEISELFGKDYILDIDLTPQRGDLCSHFGLAREIAAILGKNLTLPPLEDFGGKFTSQENINQYLQVVVEAKQDCPRYSAMMIKDYQSQDSPFFVVKTLYFLGVNIIELAVDLANYVMLIFGQPLHTFDYQKLSGKKIVIRKATDGERLQLLSQKELHLFPEDLVIADSKSPIALAGIMGGKESGISINTQKIVIESAHFQPSTIRRSAKRHLLSTEASYRFERFVDPTNTLYAAEVLARLISKYSGAVIFDGVIDLKYLNTERRKLTISFVEAERFLGQKIAKKFYRQTLENLGFQVSAKKESLEVLPPSFRNDIDCKEAVLEEVARIYGLNNLPRKSLNIKNFLALNKDYFVKETIRDIAAQLGFYEVYTSSFLPESFSDQFSFFGEAIKVSNPVSPENAYFRNSLLYGLFQVIFRNQFETDDKMRFFELGKVAYLKEGKTHEHLELAFVISPGEEEEIKSLIGALPFFSKQISFTEKSSLVTKEMEIFDNFAFIQSIEAKEKDILGYVGSLNPRGQKLFKIRKKVVFLILNLDLLLFDWQFSTQKLILPSKKVKFRPFSRFPRTIRDINFTGRPPKNLNRLLPIPDIEELKILSQYKDITTIRVIMRSSDHTLTKKEIEELTEKVIMLIEEKTALRRVLV